MVSHESSFVLRGATVVDGTGAPARHVDVVVVGDRIVAVGADAAAGHPDAAVIDLQGLVLAPGFVDPHTHYDAQVLWDPDLTPSTWHGVTTVVMGNCGFGIAPARPEHRSTILRVLENVEGMPLDALEAGVRWEFESFPEYLDTLARTPTRANVSALIGHTALRFFIMGDDATEREATTDEVARMVDTVDEALAAGAVGFSTSRSTTHVGAYGKPIPSRAANLSEIDAIADVLARRRQGTFEATFGPDFWVDEIGALAQRIERPTSWSAIMSTSRLPGVAIELADRSARYADYVHPQIACKPIITSISVGEPNSFANVPAFEQALGLDHAGRAELYTSEEWRVRARAGVREMWGDVVDNGTVSESDMHAHLVDGPTLAALAAERGVDSVDVMLDLALDEDLMTRFRLVMVNDVDAEIDELLQRKQFLLGLSDAGAHTDMLCDANYATVLLGKFHRERGVLSLEDAVWRLTGHPAAVYNIVDRGVIREGAFADLVAFDVDRIDTTAMSRVADFPAGASRLVSRGVGIEHVWVNGVATRANGEDLDGVRPGVLLRSVPDA
ncbi:MAG: amidohydrolase family protein [Actinobacteria bacterium]|nr:amidohydrolase family protein [Actinomycetota bacterium]